MTAHPTTSVADVKKNTTHRFEQTIAGQPYCIEVTPVSSNRWRAYLVRIPGVPTALMPFYGATPDDAARNLCDWLTRAHQRFGLRESTV